MLQAKEAQLNEVLARANLESGSAGTMRTKVDDLLQEKNQAVLDLQAEVERVVAAHNQLTMVVKVRQLVLACVFYVKGTRAQLAKLEETTQTTAAPATPPAPDPAPDNTRPPHYHPPSVEDDRIRGADPRAWLRPEKSRAAG